jgi:hypothetical protein
MLCTYIRIHTYTHVWSALHCLLYTCLHTREEIRSHAKMLSCTHVVGYREATTIHDDVCIMSATGTAVVLRNLQARLLLPIPLSTDYSNNCSSGNVHQSSSHTNNSNREYNSGKRRTRSVSITSSNSAKRGDSNGQMSNSSSANTSSKSLHRQSSSDDIAVSYEERSRQR